MGLLDAAKNEKAGRKKRTALQLLKTDAPEAAAELIKLIDLWYARDPQLNDHNGRPKWRTKHELARWFIPKLPGRYGEMHMSTAVRMVDERLEELRHEESTRPGN